MKSIDYKYHFRSFIDHSDCIILRGSRSESLNRVNSDIDATIITRTPEKITRNDSFYHSTIIDNISTEVLVLTIEEYKATVENIINKDYRIKDKDLHELHRLIFGLKIYGSDNQMKRDKFREKFRFLYLYDKSQYVNYAFFKAQASRESKDFYQYLYFSQCYAEALIEMALVEKSDFYIRKPYLLPRILRTFGEKSDIFKETNKLFYGIIAEELSDKSKQADALIEFGSKLLPVIYFNEKNLKKANEKINKKYQFCYCMNKLDGSALLTLNKKVYRLKISHLYDLLYGSSSNEVDDYLVASH